MERVRARDAGAFEALYDRYHRLVYGVALRVLGEQPSAEDVTQAIFMKLWTDPQSFTAGNFNAWIVRVARNRALDALRARGARIDDRRHWTIQVVDFPFHRSLGCGELDE